MTTDQLEQALLSLPAAERARLAERLIASLDQDAEIEADWIVEVQRRDEEIRSGAVAPVPLEDVLNAVRARFGW